MMNARRISFCLGVVAASFTAMAETTSTASNSRSTSAGITLGRLETRHGTIIIHPGGAADRYTVTDKTGKEVAKSLSEDQLQASFPKLYEAINGSVAEERLDASFFDRSGISADRPIPRRK